MEQRRVLHTVDASVFTGKETIRVRVERERMGENHSRRNTGEQMYARRLSHVINLNTPFGIQGCAPVAQYPETWLTEVQKMALVYQYECRCNVIGLHMKSSWTTALVIRRPNKAHTRDFRARLLSPKATLIELTGLYPVAPDWCG